MHLTDQQMRHPDHRAAADCNAVLEQAVVKTLDFDAGDPPD
jgi:hypothetical protein